jgi:hypothetical protein
VANGFYQDKDPDSVHADVGHTAAWLYHLRPSSARLYTRHRPRHRGG